MTADIIRDTGGRFAFRPAPVDAEAVYRCYLEAVCRHQGITPAELQRQFDRPYKPHRDPEWRRAGYARQLAIYLANVEGNIPQARLAEVTGMTPAAICIALRTIEDLREIRDFDLHVDIVAAEMGARV